MNRTLLFLMLLEGAAHADPYTNAVSLQLATLDSQAVSVEWEHDVGARKLSVVGALGVRGGAMGDFTSTAVGAGVELRRWLFRDTAMTGWYAGARADVSRTQLAMDDRTIGGLTTVALTAAVGYRWVVLHAIELTPSLGLATIVETGAMSPASARLAPSVGFTAGWIF